MQAVAQCVDAELMNGTMDQAGTHLLGGAVFPQEQKLRGCLSPGSNCGVEDSVAPGWVV